jgi:glutamyl/glutaminyl-tRNA synthetase
MVLIVYYYFQKFKIQNRYASDLFVELHALAIQLVKNGKCYVCFQTSEEIEVCREVRMNFEEKNKNEK